MKNDHSLVHLLDHFVCTYKFWIKWMKLTHLRKYCTWYVVHDYTIY